MTLNYVRRGSGEPLVLLHGIGSEWRIWTPQLDRLAAERDVIALDMPGFGESPPLPNGTISTVPSLTDAVESFLRELGLDHPHVAGHSTGGGVALELATRGSVRSALALSPVGFWNAGEYGWSRVLLRLDRLGGRVPRLGRALARGTATRTLAYGHMFAKPWRIPAEDASRMVDAYGNAPGFDSTLDELRGYRFEPDGSSQTPVTIAWGARDTLLLPWQARRAQRLLPHARVVRLPGCGHGAQWDDPDAVAEAVLEASSV
ncbi:MAG: alpha/beta fold hydrolase [Thermoleophilaceae bacterium]